MSEISEDLLKLFNEKYKELRNFVDNNETFDDCLPRWEESENKKDLDKFISKINTFVEILKSNNADWFRFLAMKGVLMNLKADMLVLSQNVNSAIEILVANYNELLPHASSEYVVFTYMKTAKLLLFLLAKSNDNENITKYLVTIIEIHKQVDSSRLYDCDDLFSFETNPNPRKELILEYERMFSNMLEMLVDIYEVQNNKKAYISTNHLLLEHNLKRGDCSLLLWLQNLLSLCDTLIEEEYFFCAKHHLSAATLKFGALQNTFLDKCHEYNEEGEGISEILNGLEAKLATLWVKYGVTLFLASKKMHLVHYFFQNPLEKETGQLSADSLTWICGHYISSTKINETASNIYLSEENLQLLSKIKTPIYSPFDEHDNEINALRFDMLGLNDIESSVICSAIDSSNQAKDLLNFVLAWITKAQEYFDYQEFPFEYVSLMLDLSTLYKTYAFFEPEIQRRYKVHLKRQSILNALAKVINNLDKAVYLDTHIEVAGELTQVHLDLLDTDLHRLKELKVMASKRLEKNTQNYEMEREFVKSIKDLYNGKKTTSTSVCQSSEKLSPPEKQ